ncbi:hypothetical protein KY308_02760 [Candidatus Woesearchaeota archaeon]|nr:hypothetical protein [Candidatus Woesearchaeota archaeon]
MYGGLLGLGAGMVALFVVLMIWSAVWKAIALWKAGRNNQLAWYIVLFIVNTVGILEIIYLLAFQKKHKK